MSVSPPLAAYRCGPFELFPDTRLLRGPRGEKVLGGQMFTIVERLMRRPGVLVSRDTLISALYPVPDEEPEFPNNVVAVVLVRVRALFHKLGDVDRNIIRVVYGSGWALTYTEPSRRHVTSCEVHAS